MITIDATNKSLGRVASAAAKALLGKHAADFARNTTSKVEVKVTNAAKVKLSGNKNKQMQYIRYSGYPGVTHNIVPWELHLLGLPFAAYREVPVPLPPEGPIGEGEFWNHLAYALKQWKQPIPEFMEAITDTHAVAERMAEMRRRQDIEEWRGKLDVAQHGLHLVERDHRTLDVRLVLSPAGARLEWKDAGAPEFRPLKSSQGRQFNQAYAAGQLSILPEAHPVWHALASNPYGYVSPEFRYEEPHVRVALNFLLRLPLVAERIVTPAGQPFARAAQPLRWHLDAAQSDQDDYQVRLVLPDGTAPPPVFLTLPGEPILYVSADTIYTGPPELAAISATEPNVIPAPALESGAGLQLLTCLGVELPPRIRERVERVTLSPRLACAIKPYYSGSQNQAIFVRATAHAGAGKELEVFTGAGWLPAAEFRHPFLPQRRAAEPDKLRIFEREALREVPEALEALGAKWDVPSGSWRCRLIKQWPDKLMAWLAGLPKHLQVQLEGELATVLEAPIRGEVQLECAEAGVDWFDLKVALNVTEMELTPAELKTLLDAQGHYVRLGKKGWRRLQINLSAEQDERLARLGLSTLDFSSEPQRLHALQLADEAAAQLLPAEQVAQIRQRVSELKARVNPPLPAEVRAELRPYQVEGFHFLAYLSTNRFGGILADDMGLGKTVQALTWLAWLRAQPEGARKPTLVVCPKSVMDNWRAEAERFVPGLRIALWRGTDPDKLAEAVGGTDVLVLNYTQLRALSEAVRSIDWLAAILDEGQYIKNPDSQTAQAARALKADYRLTLSGTPIENRLLDLWSLMAFAMPGMLGSRAQFAKRYDQPGDPLARRRLVARVRPFLLRRTKAQVAADLPDRVEEDLYCELEGHQKTLYRAEFKRAQQMLLNVKTRAELNEFRFHFLTSLLRLRQICCHPGLYDPGALEGESAKVNALFEVLEPLIAEGHKVLVFSQFVAMLELLRKDVKAKQWPYFYLAGDTENRGELIARFQDAPGAAVFLISLKAGGFGLNLTAASYVVLFDPWWNPAVETQAIDRTHRIGQTRKVIAYRLLAKDSIEEKIRALQRQKSALAQGVLAEENFTQSLTLEDLQYLFAGEE